MKPELEQIALGEHQSILAFEFAKDDFDAPWHFHPQFELTWILESSGTRFTGDHVGPYEAGELVLLAGNLPHCWKNQSRQAGKCRSVVVQWNEGIFPHIPELNAISHLCRHAQRGVYLAPAAAKGLETQLCEIPHLSGQTLYLSLLHVLGELAKLPFQLLSEAAFIDDLPSEYSSRMARVHEFVHAHYQRRIFLREIADILSMSEQAFSRFFSKVMGRPFFTFLNEYRINVAGRMLIETDWSVTQIAFACGYESLPFFHRQFQKFKGQSPLAFRKAHVRPMP